MGKVQLDSEQKSKRVDVHLGEIIEYVDAFSFIHRQRRCCTDVVDVVQAPANNHVIIATDEEGNEDSPAAYKETLGTQELSEGVHRTCFREAADGKLHNDDRDRP